MKRRWRNRDNCILTFLIMGISALLMGVFFDFYFDLNDDTMMRDIMSGIYSGTPDGHNMQTLYPLGALIALCYRVNGSFPWYGVFLFLCQFGCFFAVGVRLCESAEALAQKLLCLLGLTFFQWGIWLTHMVNVQYTITCGMLAGTAVFLFLTAPCTERRQTSEAVSEASFVGSFLKKSLPSLLFFLLAFQLRSEMALLLLPFLGLAGAFCWWEVRPVFTGKNLRRYGALLLLLFAGMVLLLGADALAYGGEWTEFRKLFDDRTTIYDFYPEVVTDDAYGADLESLGVSFADRLLLRNYNFGLDEGIDATMFSDVAGYAKEHVSRTRDWGAIFRESLFQYRYRSFHGDDAPFNLLVMLGYAANIIAVVMIFYHKQGNLRCRELICMAAELFLIFLTRTALWMFILMRGRAPERITHSLYLVEFCLLTGLFFRYLQRNTQLSAEFAAGTESVERRHGGSAGFRRVTFCAAAVICLFFAAGMTKTVPAVRTDQARRQALNRDWEAIDAYCRARSDTFYFEDVYSTVAFSGKLLECGNTAAANYDIAGGWICKSPLYRKKLALFGIEAAADALAEGRAGFIMSDGEAKQGGITWLTALYAEKDIKVSVEEYDRIGESYGVYQIVPVSESGQYLRKIK